MLERDEQLSSFKTILEEKESLRQQQLEKEKTLTTSLEEIAEQKALAQSKITELEARLTTTKELVRQSETNITNKKKLIWNSIRSIHSYKLGELKEVRQHLEKAQSELRQQERVSRRSFGIK